MSEEFVGREEHTEAVRRLDVANAELRTMIQTTERYLSSETDRKLKDAVLQLREDLKDDLAGAKESFDAGLGGIQERLTWQNRTFGTALITLLVLVAAALITHAFGVG
jgi:hypothetical protein